MRVTKETQQETRRRLLEAARGLFAEQGFDPATTREVAKRANVANGTLFNYFASKEALGAALILVAAETARAEFETKRRAGESLAEILFAWVAIQLRHLEPFRPWMSEVLDAGSSLLLYPTEADETDAQRFRRMHLDRVATWIQGSTRSAENPLDLHLYWTLFLGVIEFWTRDASHNQEATLALLDRSISLFTRGITEGPQES